MLVKELLEARHVDKNVSYSVKEAKNKVVSVTAKLENNKSGIFTKLAARYKEVDEKIKELSEERNKMNEKIKSEVLEYFDAEDEVLTRIVETVSLTAQLAKQAKDSEKIDDSEVVTKLLESATPELAKQIEELRKQCTKIVKAKSPALTVRINEGVLDTLKKALSRFLNSIKSWAFNYDKKLNRIRAIMG